MKLLHHDRAVFAPMVDALAVSGGSRKATSDPVRGLALRVVRAPALRFIDRMITASRRSAHTG